MTVQNTMTELLYGIVADYCSKNSKLNFTALNEIDRYTHTETLKPQMSTDNWQGSFLHLITRLKSPKVAVELGTFTGYATYCFAKAMLPQSKLVTIEIDEETHLKTQERFKAFSFDCTIDWIHGSALESLKELALGVDLAFVDAKKIEYQEYYSLLLKQLNPGGILILDNMLWYGKVINSKKDKTSQHLHELNVMIQNDASLTNCLIPIRDGLHLVMKK